jgi:hypothetical protein
VRGGRSKLLEMQQPAEWAVPRLMFTGTFGTDGG